MIGDFKRCAARGGVSAFALAVAIGCIPDMALGQSATSQASSPQNGQGELQEVLVTAERRTSSVQKTAASVSVEKGDDLQQQGKFTLTDILQTVPGVFGGESLGTSNEPTGNDNPAEGITIRGISSNGGLSGQTISGIPSTALYVDDVYSGIGGNYDIDRVEVLRGPQGTLYGRSATAGVVAIHTRNPDLTALGGDASIEGGSYGLLHVTGAANIPIIDNKLALRVSGNEYERNGVDAVRGYGAQRISEGKVKLLYAPSDDFSLLLGGALQDRMLYNGGSEATQVAPNKFVYTPLPEGKASTNPRQLWAELHWDLGAAQLTYLPSYRSWNQNALVYVVGPGGGAIKQPVQTPSDHFITQELRLSSPDNAAIKWQTGLFYYDNNLHNINESDWSSSNALLFSADIRRQTRDIGAFAESTVSLAEDLRATVGLRYDDTSVRTSEMYANNVNALCNTVIGPIFGCGFALADSPQAGLPVVPATVSITGDQGHRDFTNVTYKARLEYDLSPADLLYGMVSTGFLPGDVQIGTGPGNLPIVSAYDSEILTTYEIGSKNRFFDKRLQVNADLFYNDYGGYQASILRDPTNPGSASFYNVPLTMVGFELETEYRVTPEDRVGLNLSHIDSRFHNLPADFTAAAAERSLWGFAPTTVTATYDHSFNLPNGSVLALHAEGDWRSGYDVFSTTAALAAQGGVAYVHQNPFFLGNLALTWTPSNGAFSITGYVNNIGDERYKTYVNLQTITPLSNSGTQSDPRTVGAVLSAHF